LACCCFLYKYNNNLKDLYREQDLVVSDLVVHMFDSSHGRTCLHYAAYYGHVDCLRTILSGWPSSPRPSRRCSLAPLLMCSQLWRCRGFARFVNVRDDTGAKPLHLAARQGWRRCVHVLLENGAIVSASSGAFG
jgi:E3 ubiquitin-protein ligase XBAT32/33